MKSELRKDVEMPTLRQRFNLVQSKLMLVGVAGREQQRAVKAQFVVDMANELDTLLTELEQARAIFNVGGDGI